MNSHQRQIVEWQSIGLRKVLASDDDDYQRAVTMATICAIGELAMKHRWPVTDDGAIWFDWDQWETEIETLAFDKWLPVVAAVGEAKADGKDVKSAMLGALQPRN